MFFKTNDFYVDLIKNEDLNEVIEVYNSNKHFLINHMDKDKITNEWIINELESMKKVGFFSCKIVDVNSEKIIGVIDFKIEHETYLSLLMIHSDFKNKGFGKLLFKSFEEYAKSLKSKCIRIDVVTNYDDSVLNFWSKNGFTKFKNVTLNWTGKDLPATTMKKVL